MSYQQQPGGPPGMPGAPQNGGQPPPGPVQQQQIEREHAEQALREILGGELPGADYLFASDPAKRQEQLIQTTPEFVRASLLRAIEVASWGMVLPYGMEKKGELGKAILEMSQAYLLLDPSVDNQGVPVGAQAHAQGQAQADAAHAQGEAQRTTAEHQHGLNVALEEHKADMQARVAAHASGEVFKRPVTVNGYVEPPRVQPNPAEKEIAEKHKEQSQQLKGARGDRPLPRPRVGA